MEKFLLKQLQTRSNRYQIDQSQIRQRIEMSIEKPQEKPEIIQIKNNDTQQIQVQEEKQQQILGDYKQEQIQEIKKEDVIQEQIQQQRQEDLTLIDQTFTEIKQIIDGDKVQIQNSIFSQLQILIGKPFSGKSFYIQDYIKNNKQKYDFIYFVTPASFDKLDLSDDNAVRYYEPDKIIEKLCQKGKELNTQSKQGRFLLILDDVVSMIKKEQLNPHQTTLFYNRRKLIDGFILDIILTTQKYNIIPPNIRSLTTTIIVFKICPDDWKQIKKELITQRNYLFDKAYQKSQEGEYNFLTIDLNQNKILFNNEDVYSFNFKF